MESTISPAPSSPDAPSRRVRTDLVLGVTVLAVVIGGNVIRHASDAGVLSALGR